MLYKRKISCARNERTEKQNTWKSDGIHWYTWRQLLVTTISWLEMKELGGRFSIPSRWRKVMMPYVKTVGGFAGGVGGFTWMVLELMKGLEWLQSWCNRECWNLREFSDDLQVMNWPMGDECFTPWHLFQEMKRSNEANGWDERERIMGHAKRVTIMPKEGSLSCLGQTGNPRCERLTPCPIWRDVGDVIHVVTAAENHSAPGRHGRSFHVKEDISCSCVTLLTILCKCSKGLDWSCDQCCVMPLPSS